MYRLLIADDEALEREGLELMVSRMLPETFEFLHAENGRRAIQLTEEGRPDVIFMDINMPGIQGLEAIREITSLHPNTKIILVTAYDYFSYAKEALTLGVKEYILKPAKKEQIAEVLQKILLELGQERKKRGEELQLKEKISQMVPLAESEFAILLMFGDTQDSELASLAELLDYQWDQGYALVLRFPKEVKKEHVHALKSFMKSQLPCVISPMIGNKLAIFVLSNQLLGANKLNEWLEQKIGVPFEKGIGSVKKGIRGLRNSYLEAIIETGDAEDPPSIGFDHDMKEERDGKLIDRILTYLNHHFREDISMEMAAEYVNLSPFYFSKFFKARVGQTFVDYMTNLRIDFAKNLISNHELSLKEICYEVGYKDPNYFSRVFKKITGVTPSEFRKSPCP